MSSSNELIFPSDNEYGIPALLPQKDKSLGVQQPVIVWGSTARTVKQAGTICFYTDDYRFNALWQAPERALDSCAGAVVEPNYSIMDDTPAAVAIWHTYRKRWLARFLQDASLTVWVDLCVPLHFQHINLLGVPRTWGHYATAAWDSRVGDLDHELETARKHASGYPFCLLVYGGGSKVTQWVVKSQAEGNPIVRAGHRADARKRPGQGTRQKMARESILVDDSERLD